MACRYLKNTKLKFSKGSNMNRKAKLQKLHDKRLKRARAKTKTSSKERYISKADRANTESENSTAESNSEECSTEVISS